MALRVACVLFSVVWLTFGFGIIDFVSGFTSVGDADPLGIGVLSVAYGSIAGVVLPVAFLALLRQPERRPAAVQQIVAVALAFAVAGAVALDPLCFISVTMLALMLASVLALHPVRPPLLPAADRLSRPVLLLAALAVPWLGYAWAAAANSRASLPPEEMAARPQAGGWAGAAALALAVVLLAVLAATRTPGWRVPQWSAALASISFGTASLLNPELPGSPGTWWGALAVAWGLAFIAAGELSGKAAGGRPPATRRGSRRKAHTS